MYSLNRNCFFVIPTIWRIAVIWDFVNWLISQQRESLLKMQSYFWESSIEGYFWRHLGKTKKCVRLQTGFQYRSECFHITSLRRNVFVWFIHRKISQFKPIVKGKSSYSSEAPTISHRSCNQYFVINF